MRIIAGCYKNRRIFSHKGRWLRPTSDQTRETIFSLLGDRIEDNKILDLFAGTGALGVEAMSRGATEVTFVDKSAQSISIIKKNLEQLKIEAILFKSDALAFIRRAGKENRRYNLIFCDPPYDYALTKEIVKEIEQNRLLIEKGVFVLETSSRSTTILGKGLQIFKQKRMGDTTITIYEQGNEQ